MGTRLPKILIAVFFAAAVQVAAFGQAPVPVEMEPMHQLKFQNDFVRVFDVNIPAGSTSQLHTHVYDAVNVQVSNAQIVEAITGSGNPSKKIKFGDVSFTERAAPMTHTMTNGGNAPYRTIFIELMPARRKPSKDSMPVLSGGHEILIDNARVRVSRLTLQPGESSMLHTHAMPGLSISLYDSKLEISTISGGAKELEMKAGDVAWQSSGTTHMIRNVGTSVFEALDIEIK